jgi:hypothetical protein
MKRNPYPSQEENSAVSSHKVLLLSIIVKIVSKMRKSLILETVRLFLLLRESFTPLTQRNSIFETIGKVFL